MSIDEPTAFDKGYETSNLVSDGIIKRLEAELAKVTAERDLCNEERLLTVQERDAYRELAENNDDAATELAKAFNKAWRQRGAALEGWRKSECHNRDERDHCMTECETGPYCQAVLEHCKVES